MLYGSANRDLVQWQRGGAYSSGSAPYLEGGSYSSGRFPYQEGDKRGRKKQRQRKTQEIKLYTTSIVLGSYTGAPNGGENAKSPRRKGTRTGLTRYTLVP